MFVDMTPQAAVQITTIGNSGLRLQSELSTLETHTIASRSDILNNPFLHINFDNRGPRIESPVGLKSQSSLHPLHMVDEHEYDCGKNPTDGYNCYGTLLNYSDVVI